MPSALLIGCNYPGSQAALQGCANDVLATKDMLTTYFGFTEENITILLDSDSQYTTPTGKNIKDALKNMVDTAQDSDVLFVHYSGHGAQVPSDDADETDGKDEVLVATDFNLISDDDLRDILMPLASKNVKFTMVADCCHSGTLLDNSQVVITGSKDNDETAVSAANESAVQAMLAAVGDGSTRQFVSRSLPLDSLLGHLSNQLGEPVTQGNVRASMHKVFGDDASAKVLSYVKYKQSAPANTTSTPGFGGDETAPLDDSTWTDAAPADNSTYTDAAPADVTAGDAAPADDSTYTDAAPADVTAAEAAPADDYTYTDAAPADASTYTAADAAPLGDSTYTDAAPAEDSAYTDAAPADESTYTAADAAPAEDSAYTDAAPADAAPADDSTYTDAAPADATATDAAPAEDSTFTDAAPADAAPADESTYTAADAAPLDDSTYTDAATADATATDAAPAEDSAYTDAAPADESTYTAADAAPADESTYTDVAPADATATDAAPAEDSAYTDAAPADESTYTAADAATAEDSTFTDAAPADESTYTAADAAPADDSTFTDAAPADAAPVDESTYAAADAAPLDDSTYTDAAPVQETFTANDFTPLADSTADVAAAAGYLAKAAQTAAAPVADVFKPVAGGKPPPHLRLPKEVGILITGCQDTETSADVRPSNNPQKAHGALSGAIRTVVTAHFEKTPDIPLTNRTLVLAIREILEQTGFAQNPCLECSEENADQLFIVRAA